MGERESESIPQLIQSLMTEAQALVHDELAIFRLELRAEMAAAQAAGVWFVVAAVTGLIGVVLLCVALGAAVSSLFGLPSWAGYGVVAVLLLMAAAFFVSLGRARAADIGGLPVTRASLKENVAWMQNKSVGK